jgi:putative DNA primase/helicase
MANVFGLQFIYGSAHPRKKKIERDKEFWPSGMAMKGHYFIIGPSPTKLILVAEGYATAATLFEETGITVAVAFNANNLLPVAQNLKKRYKNIKFLICADDDYLTSGNPGITSAQSAALAVGGEWVAPVFSIDRQGKKLTDFNDLLALEGAGVVKSQIEQAIHSHGWGLEAPPNGEARHQGGGGDALKSLLSVEEAVDRYSLIYGAGGTMFDHQEAMLISKSDVLDICPDHAWREWKFHLGKKLVRLQEVGFDPTEHDEKITCNLWGGWPTKPKKGQCDLLLSLLRELCRNEEDKNSDAIYQWVLKWLAYPIQHPGAKMKTSLIFHGLQGVGKNLFFEAYAAIYEKYSIVVGQSEIDDKFNDWASAKLFMIADEVVARQELFHIKNKIKALITGDTIRINPKNVAAHSERNHANIVFLSNETQPLVLEPGDRRFMVVWCPALLTENIYSDVADEVKEGGIEALHDYLLNLDLANFNEHSKPPMTKSKQDLIEINLGSVERFVQDWRSGDLGLPYVICSSQDLYKSYHEWCKKQGVVRPRELSQFIGTISKMPGWAKERKRTYKDLRFSGEQIITTLIFPLTDGVRDEKFNTDTEWYTDCVFKFRNAMSGEND